MVIIGHIIEEGNLNHGETIELFTIGNYVHGYGLGSSGVGKTTLLKKLAIEQMRSGKGLLYIDPLGVSAPDLLGYVPRTRQHEVVYIDLADREYSFVWNPLQDVQNPARAAREITTAFTRSVGDTITTTTINVILTGAIMAMIERGGTLTSVLKFLMFNDFRSNVVDKLSPHLCFEWLGIFQQYNMRSSPFQSSISRVKALLDSPEIREIFRRPYGKFHMDKAIDEGKIIILNGNPSIVGAEASSLFLSIFFHLFTMSCERQPLKIPYLIVGDEIQKYVTETVAETLSSIRNYNVKLLLAHQYRNQIKDLSTRSAMMANADLKFIFRVPDDAKELAEHFRLPLHKLMNLPNYEAYILHDNDHDRVRMASLRPSGSHKRMESVLKSSRMRNCRKRL